MAEHRARGGDGFAADSGAFCAHAPLGGREMCGELRYTLPAGCGRGSLVWHALAAFLHPPAGRLWDAHSKACPRTQTTCRKPPPCPRNAIGRFARHTCRRRTISAAAAPAGRTDRLDYIHPVGASDQDAHLCPGPDAQSTEPVDRELLRQEVFKIGQYAMLRSPTSGCKACTMI
jgi:hypothetical protein